MAIVDEMLARLTDAYNKTKESNLGKLMQLISVELTELKDTFTKIESYRDIDTATGVTLDKHGKNVSQYRGQVSDAIFRVLIKGRIKRNLSDGDLNTIVEITSFMLGIDITAVYLEEKWPDEPAALLVSVPPESLNSIGLSFQQFSQLMNKVVAGGVAAYLRYEGTFQFSSVVDQSESDAGAGFADLTGTTGGYFGAYYDPGDDVVLPW